MAREVTLNDQTMANLGVAQKAFDVAEAEIAKWERINQATRGSSGPQLWQARVNLSQAWYWLQGVIAGLDPSMDEKPPEPPVIKLVDS